MPSTPPLVDLCSTGQLADALQHSAVHLRKTGLQPTELAVSALTAALAGAQKARNAQASLAKSALVELADAQQEQQQLGQQQSVISMSSAPAPAVGSSARGKKSVRQAV